MCFIDGCFEHMDDKIRAGYVPNDLYKNMDLVHRLSLYNSNIEMFQRESLNKIATLEG
jgi:hypothetical protein